MTSRTTPIHIRIPEDLKEAAVAKADSKYLSLTQYVLELIRDDLGARRPSKRKSKQTELELTRG